MLDFILISDIPSIAILPIAPISPIASPIFFPISFPASTTASSVSTIAPLVSFIPTVNSAIFLVSPDPNGDFSQANIAP